MNTQIPKGIVPNISLAEKTWFKTGGSAEFFVAPTNAQEASAALQWASKKGLQHTIIGQGANILISDEGIKGLVLCMNNQSITHNENNVIVDAGCSVDDLINYALKNHLGGLEDFSSIPGSIGGATAMNIHYFDALFSTFISTVTFIDLTTNTVATKTIKECNFGYNQSIFLDGSKLITQVTLTLKKLTPLETAYAQGRADEIRRQRARRYPTARTCGSFFRNFFPHEYQKARGNCKVPYVAYYLEAVGVKGQLSYGGASVFPLHANMLVTKENGTSNDICTLAHLMQKKVYDQFGIWPEPECQLLGFTKNPLKFPLT